MKPQNKLKCTHIHFGKSAIVIDDDNTARCSKCGETFNILEGTRIVDEGTAYAILSKRFTHQGLTNLNIAKYMIKVADDESVYENQDVEIVKIGNKYRINWKR